MVEVIRHERDLERAKIELSLREDFNLIDAFAFFDIQNSGYFSSNELKQILASYGVDARFEDVHLVFKRYNQLGDGMLKFGEFS
jgi:Ca2+-binding EF-hand superfamily protein